MSSTMRSHIRKLHSSLTDPISSSSLSNYQCEQANACRPNPHSLIFRLADIISRTWHLGFTAFGGPAVHFAIFHRAFVIPDGKYAPWIDEQTYQDVFALCQSLSGPGSTKMLFVMELMHGGLVCALVGFFIWSLPGAIGMFLVSLGVSNIQNQLSLPVCGLLSGLNAASVGIIFLAAVELATKASKDNLTRLLVIAGGCTGLVYSALWYFPVLIVLGGLTALVWDTVLSRAIGKVKARLQRRRDTPNESGEELAESVPVTTVDARRPIQATHRRAGVQVQQATSTPTDQQESVLSAHMSNDDPDLSLHILSLRIGLSVVLVFIITFIVIITTRGVLPNKTLTYSLFSNMFLAGTIIFGGGPVVSVDRILAREELRLMSTQDSTFTRICGRARLGICSGFLDRVGNHSSFPRPGMSTACTPRIITNCSPNFNFAVYLGALALKSTSPAGISGAVLAFIGIFLPGITLAVGVQSVWNIMRTKPWVISILRGVNSIAVGFVFTAVYRLWEIGFLTPNSTEGMSLANDPWWVVVAVLAYSATCWYKVPPAVSIVGGAVLGLCWYGVTSR